jgi:hypothetical protein
MLQIGLEDYAVIKPHCTGTALGFSSPGEATISAMPRRSSLRIYAHLFRKDDGKAAATVNAALSAKPKA